MGEAVPRFILTFFAVLLGLGTGAVALAGPKEIHSARPETLEQFEPIRNNIRLCLSPSTRDNCLRGFRRLGPEFCVAGGYPAHQCAKAFPVTLEKDWEKGIYEALYLVNLGNYFQDQGDLFRALLIWRSGTVLTDEQKLRDHGIPDLREKISLVITQEIHDKPLTATQSINYLILHNTFASYAPYGPEGLIHAEQLRHRLIGVGLADAAADQIIQEMRFSYGGESKAKAGARAAALYLHANSPERAIKAITRSVVRDITDETWSKRNWLLALAYHQSGKNQKARSLLIGDFSQKSSALRLEIALAERDFILLSRLIGSILLTKSEKPGWQPGHEDVWLFDAWLSTLVMTRDSDGLNILKDNFQELARKLGRSEFLQEAKLRNQLNMHHIISQTPISFRSRTYIADWPKGLREKYFLPG